MDCDDFQLLLAMPGNESEALSNHLAECEACGALAAHLEEEDLPTEPTEEEEEDSLIGTVVGAYEIAELVGSGGMGRVYLAVHPTIGSRVAIKVFSKDWNQHPNLVARFFAEAHATNRIAHENIVNVLDVGRLQDERPYLIMEYLLGNPLSRLVGSEELNDALLLQIMQDVLGALSAAHAHKIVHRDLKPDNIFVSPEGRATLLDFGIAKLVPELGDSAPTATGTVLGTPHYMSPEQAVGDPVDTRTDVYAMGIILYECFTGKRPFSGSSLYRLMDQHVNSVPTPPSQLRPDIGADVEAIILKALAKSPDKRYATPTEMRTALQECEGDATKGAFQHKSSTSEHNETVRLATAATIPNGPKPPEREQKQKRVATAPRAARPALLALSFLLLTGLGAGIFFGTSRDAGTKGGAPDATLVSLTTTPALPADATMVPPADAAPSPVDAAPVDASAELTNPAPKPRTTPPRSSGTAPLSLLREATRLAQAKEADAVLARVRLYKPNRQGRMNLTEIGREVQFDFVSPTKAARVAARNRKSGICVVRVAFFRGAKGTVSSVGAQCAELRFLPKPPCSVQAMMKVATKQGNLPAEGEITSAVLQLSRSSHNPRAFWKIEIEKRSFNVGACG